MKALHSLLPTAYYSPAERLLHGKRLAAAIGDGAPEVWLRLDQGVCIRTRSAFRRGSSRYRVGFHWFDGREIADWTTAPHWHEGHGVTWTALPPGEPELALALCHGDARVRESALQHASDRPDLLPLVLLRSADNTASVRNRARALLTTALPTAPTTRAQNLVPLAVLVSARGHGNWGWEQLLARLGGIPTGPITDLLAAPDAEVRAAAVDLALRYGLPATDRMAELVAGETHPRILLAALGSGLLGPERTAAYITEGTTPEVRRAALDLTLRSGVLSPARVAEIAATSTDRVVRRRCTRAVTALLDNPRGDIPAGLLDSLLTIRSATLRTAAVGALRRAGRAHELPGHLLDRAAPVRAAARRELGADVDAQAYYRALCADAPTPAAVTGLAEGGCAEDTGLLWGLTGHPDGSVRVRAVSGLRARGAASPTQLMPFLLDPHPGVVRAVRSALRGGG